MESGGIAKEGGLCYTTRDLAFSTPSAAGDFVLGRSCNGWREWVDDNNLTLGDIYRK
ncbi:MAG: DUF4357 domain-containing protein [Clostridia bacterium]|nr:DUF4357 domain-containing protein [Clostridia bacterium]